MEVNNNFLFTPSQSDINKLKNITGKVLRHEASHVYAMFVIILIITIISYIKLKPYIKQLPLFIKINFPNLPELPKLPELPRIPNLYRKLQKKICKDQIKTVTTTQTQIITNQDQIKTNVANNVANNVADNVADNMVDINNIESAIVQMQQDATNEFSNLRQNSSVTEKEIYKKNEEINLPSKSKDSNYICYRNKLNDDDFTSKRSGCMACQVDSRIDGEFYSNTGTNVISTCVYSDELDPNDPSVWTKQQCIDTCAELKDIKDV